MDKGKLLADLRRREGQVAARSLLRAGGDDAVVAAAVDAARRGQVVARSAVRCAGGAA